jgi:hypothetical protein
MKAIEVQWAGRFGAAERDAYPRLAHCEVFIAAAPVAARGASKYRR